MTAVGQYRKQMGVCQTNWEEIDLPALEFRTLSITNKPLYLPLWQIDSIVWDEDGIISFL